METMTNKAISKELGRRIEQLRLEQNMTQQYLADAIGISRISYAKLESGEAKIINVIASLRVLGQLSQLESFIPDTTFSPIELLKMKGKKRQRARSSSKSKNMNRKSNQNKELDW
jgi:transcriptional regulator with XRE-family HTH domain